MAIVQISQIKHRRGTNENLPQLASAELGWSVDTQQLYIGNGTLAEGAPEIGNTEILTMASVERGDIPGIPAVITANLVNDSTNVAITGSSISATQLGATVNYTVTRNYNARTGTIRVGHNGTTVATDEEYSETADVGVAFAFYDIGSNVAQLFYTTTNTGYNANLSFTVSTF